MYKNKCKKEGCEKKWNSPTKGEFCRTHAGIRPVKKNVVTATQKPKTKKNATKKNTSRRK